MKRFVFRLERLLTLRKYAEREWELKLAEATGKCIVERREIEQRLEHKAAAFKNFFGGGLSTLELAASHLYLARLDQEIERHERALAGFELEREKVQKDYLAASKQRKILDKLSERQLRAHQKEQNKKDIEQIDDINSGRAARSNQSPVTVRSAAWRDTE